MALMTQFTLLLWKNFTLRRRQKVRLLVEIVWPLFLFIILVGVRASNKPVYKDQCHYPNKAMPSAGVLPWLQGIVCDLSNPCLRYPTPGEARGQVNNYNHSVVAGFLIEFQNLLVDKSFLRDVELLADNLDRLDSILSGTDLSGRPVPLRSVLIDNETFSGYLRDELSVSPAVVQSLMTANVSFNPMTGIPGNPTTVLCEGEALDDYIQFNSQAEKGAFRNVTCSLDRQQLMRSQREFLRNLDQRKLFATLPSPAGLNPAGTSQLMQETLRNAVSVITEVSALRGSAAFEAASSLDFGGDMLGSVNLLLCGQRLEFNSTDGTRSRTFLLNQTSGLGTSGLASNSSTNSSGFCETLVDTLEGTPGLSHLWNALRPLLQGKVLYTPDTPAARLIVTEANATFHALAILKELADSWEVMGPRIWDFFNNSSEVESIRRLLNETWFSAVLDQGLNGTELTADLIARFLYNGPPRTGPRGGPTGTGVTPTAPPDACWPPRPSCSGSCLDLNKFEPVADEVQLVIKALELLEEDRFWAAVVLENLQPNASLPPAHVRYTIRMDIDEVERTNKLKARSWSPGAKDNFLNDLRYVWGGFAYLQDMMDAGITRVHTAKKRLFGVFLQQMPYPCYVDDVFIRSMGSSLPMFFVLAFTYTVCQTIKSLVLEKERGLKEVLRAVGVTNGALWCAWFTENMTMLLVPSVLLSVMLKVSTEDGAGEEATPSTSNTTN
ncbi:hypothetical protein NHX12_013584 [Muraenolepis orangiensis]|uniref:Uncharacterized protein n=1 Tax=Muraenolepis orangiensis TaxID=630683 RepID=A0A9Q0I602_9TELE|nr:hypothetical protein NHX12_013584 [Muraenolepis orangiensis]